MKYDLIYLLFLVRAFLFDVTRVAAKHLLHKFTVCTYLIPSAVSWLANINNQSHNEAISLQGNEQCIN